jgi:hypothetical protein
MVLQKNRSESEMLLKKKKKRELKTAPPPRVGCPFCLEWLPPPKQIDNVFSPEGCSGGHCACGAVFVVDETGRLGGQALLDAQALLCAGDMTRALALDASKDIEVKNRQYQEPTRGFAAHAFKPVGSRTKLWAIRFAEKPDTSSQ